MGQAELIDAAALRQRVDALEAAMLALPQVNAHTTHALAGRVYARTILIPAGCVLTGAVHKKDHLNIVSGDVSFVNEDGQTRLTGYHVIATKAGSKRCAVAHTDTWWTTVLHTDCAELADIEADAVEDPEALQSRTLGQNQLLKLEE